jgi:hypothetical protein
MTDKTTNGEGRSDEKPGGAAPLNQGKRLPPPGLAAIALYLLVLAAATIVGAASGRHYPPEYLIFSALFIAASAGLLLLLRWAWALALGAVFLLALYYLWVSTVRHDAGALVEGLLNLVFFLYMVRAEVREKLR